MKVPDLYSEVDNSKLARAYVVLALARDVAQSYMKQKPSHAGLHPVVTMLDITNDLLEEILEHSMPAEISSNHDDEVCSELLM